MIASHRAQFFFLIISFFCFSTVVATEKTTGSVGAKPQVLSCTVRDVCGKKVRVAQQALIGPFVFLVLVRGGSIKFWTLADAQCLLRKIAQCKKIGSLQHKLNALCEYVANRHQQPADEVKHALVLELFDEFNIAPRELKNFSEWSIAVVEPTRDLVTDPFMLVNQSVDLSVIDAKTGKVTSVAMVEEVKQKMLGERASGVVAFPFLYHRKKRNHKKMPDRSVTVATVGATSWLVKALVSVVVVGGGGVAVSKMKKSSSPERITAPLPRVTSAPIHPQRHTEDSVLEPTVVDATRPAGIKPLAKASYRRAFSRFRRGRERDSLQRMKRDFKNDCSAAERVSLEISDTEVLKKFLHKCSICTAKFADQSEPPQNDENVWVDYRRNPPKMPLFFLKVEQGARAVAVSVKCYKAVLTQCTEEELQLLDEQIPVHAVPEAPDSLMCDCALISDSEIIELFKKYALELFE